jgi:hypothetical protein
VHPRDVGGFDDPLGEVVLPLAVALRGTEGPAEYPVNYAGTRHGTVRLSLSFTQSSVSNGAPVAAGGDDDVAGAAGAAGAVGKAVAVDNWTDPNTWFA